MIKNCTCEKDFTQNPSTYECECNKYCMIGEYLQGCESMKSLIDDLVVSYDGLQIHKRVHKSILVME